MTMEGEVRGIMEHRTGGQHEKGRDPALAYSSAPLLHLA